MANSPHDIDFALSLKNWAVVGLGNNPERAAYGVAKVLLDKGHHVIPIYPRAEVVHGQQGYVTLAEVPEQIDVVDLFVNSSRAPRLNTKNVKNQFAALIYSVNFFLFQLPDREVRPNISLTFPQ